MNISDLDPNDIKPVQMAQSGPTHIPGVSAPLSLSQLNPDDIQLEGENPLQAKYGGLAQQALTGVESAARTGSLGASDFVENELAKLNPELFGADARKKRVEANPATAFGGAVLGGAGLGVATGGFGGLAAGLSRGVGGGLLGAAAGTAAEGAIFGAGNVVSDLALGDPNLNAQKVLGELAAGAIGGAVIGTALHGLGVTIGVGKALLKNAKGEIPAAVDELPSAAQAGIPEPIYDLPKGEKPSSLAEMQKKLEDLKKYNNQANLDELPQKADAMAANARLSDQMQVPITDMQMNSLDSQDARMQFKTLVEVPGKDGEILRNWQGAQKKELAGILDNTIKGVAPGYQPTVDAAEAGERAADAFTKVIQGTRDELGPAFEQIKNTPLNSTDHLPGVIEYLTNSSASPYANPKLANMFETGGDEIAIAPYKTSMGIDKSTYTAVKQAVEALKEDPKNFEQLFDIRKGLSQNVDIMKLGDAPKEIAAAKASLMDYIQEAVQSVDPDLAVRDTFKKWAINEQNAQMIEKKFGAEIGSNNFRSLAKGKPEEQIIRKIFGDSETVKAVKNILPAEDFNKLLADHLSIIRNDVTDKGVFSSNRFNSAIKKNQYALNEAFIDNPDGLQKMKDSLTLLRIFADDTPQNPSGTTKTLLQAIMSGGINPSTLFSNLVEYGKGKMAEQKVAMEINQKLANTAAGTNKLGVIQSVVEKADKKIESNVKDIWNGVKGGVLGGATELTDKEFEKIREKLGEITTNPMHHLDNFAHNTQHLYSAVPNITQGIHTQTFQNAQFLASKLPQPPVQMPFSPKWEPSKSQKIQFNRYYQAVNNPIGAMKSVSNGSLTNETMEALQATNPHLLAEMQFKIAQAATPEKMKNLNYAQKLSLGKFLGQPLDENMVGAAIQSNQAAMNAPQQSQQTSQAGARKSSLGGLKQLKTADRVRTRANSFDE